MQRRARGRAVARHEGGGQEGVWPPASDAPRDRGGQDDRARRGRAVACRGRAVACRGRAVACRGRAMAHGGVLRARGGVPRARGCVPWACGGVPRLRRGVEGADEEGTTQRATTATVFH
jgi:hypothetical protein